MLILTIAIMMIALATIADYARARADDRAAQEARRIAEARRRYHQTELHWARVFLARENSAMMRAVRQRYRYEAATHRQRRDYHARKIAFHQAALAA